MILTGERTLDVQQHDQPTLLDMMDNLDGPSDHEEVPLFATEYTTTKEKIAKTVFAFSMSAVSGTSIYLATQAVKDIENQRWKYSLCTWTSGASLALFFHTIIPPNLRQRIYRVMSACAYEYFFTGTQFHLNFFSDRTMRILHGGFVGISGYFLARDCAIMFSLPHSGYGLTLNNPKDERELIPMLSINDPEFLKVNESGQLILALCATALFFILRNNYADQHGFCGNLAAGYLGFRIGRIITYLSENLREKYEKKYQEAPQEAQIDLPFGLKFGRIVNKGFSFTSSIITALLLQCLSKPSKYTPIDNPTNSVTDYLAMSGIGGILGAKLLLEEVEVKNPLSNFHVKRESIQKKRADRSLSSTTTEKVCNFVKDYFFTLLCMVALDAYMTTVGIRSGEPRIINAIVTLLLSSHLFFFAANYMIKNFTPMKSSEINSTLSTIQKLCNNRFTNELYFHCAKPTLLITAYQYFTTKFNLFDSHMDSAPPQLLLASYAGWGLWGAVWGTLRTLYVQEMEPHPFTSDLAAIEMTNTFVEGLRA